MPWFRIGEPGDDHIVHINFGRRKATPMKCRAPRLEGDNPKLGDVCGRMSEALCDGPAGQDLSGKPQTCDMPICERHRTRGGPNIDYCPRHSNLAPRELSL